MSELAYVFGYGSLAASATAQVDRRRRPAGFVVDLPGFRRHWGVAMDNARDLPGYKRYRDPDGGRPAVFVAFLDIAPAAGASVNGVCRPVSADELAALDRRERNYVRVDVAAALRSPVPVWAYAGSAAGRARLRTGRALGTAVIDTNYLATVRRGFRALGEGEWERCAPSLHPDGLALRELRREPVDG